MGLMDRLLGRSDGARPIPVNGESFDELLLSNKYAVVDFWSKYCPPCHAVDPVVKKLAREYQGKVLFLKISVTSNPQLAERFRVKSVPAFLFFVDGKLKDRRVGAMSYEAFKDWIESLIGGDQ